MSINRRQFMRRAAGAVSTAAFMGAAGSQRVAGQEQTLPADTFSIGYYEEAALPFYAALARNFTTLDNYFASIHSSTFPNRVFQYAAQTDRISNTLDLF